MRKLHIEVDVDPGDGVILGDATALARSLVCSFRGVSTTVASAHWDDEVPPLELESVEKFRLPKPATEQWELTTATTGRDPSNGRSIPGEDVEALLAEGWEPFQVLPYSPNSVNSNIGARIWFRRMA